MTFLRTCCVALSSASLFFAAPARAGEIVVPNNAPTTAGNGGYSTLMHPQERSYQLVVGPEELGGLAVGSVITGITWRRPSWIVYPDWPGVGSVASYTNYDIYLSTSNNPPGSLSTTYTNNIGSDVVQVRGGPLSLSGPHFPGGALKPSVNPFGMLIPFSTPYTYKGGDLLLTIRHTGNSLSSGYLDTVSSPYYQAIGVSSYTQPNNWYNQGLITMKLVFDDPPSTFCTPQLPGTCGVASLSAPSASASKSAGSGSFPMTASPVSPGPQPSLLLYGSPPPAGPIATAFGDLCISPFFRAAQHITLPTTGPACGALYVYDGGDIIATYSQIQVGNSYLFQGWFRDPPTGSGARFTEGLGPVAITP